LTFSGVFSPPLFSFCDSFAHMHVEHTHDNRAPKRKACFFHDEKKKKKKGKKSLLLCATCRRVRVRARQLAVSCACPSLARDGATRQERHSEAQATRAREREKMIFFFMIFFRFFFSLVSPPASAPSLFIFVSPWCVH